MVSSKNGQLVGDILAKMGDLVKVFEQAAELEPKIADKIKTKEKSITDASFDVINMINDSMSNKKGINIMKFKLNQDIRIGGAVVRKGSIVEVVKSSTPLIDFAEVEQHLLSMYSIDADFTASNPKSIGNKGNLKYECFATIKDISAFRQGPYVNLYPTVSFRVVDFLSGHLSSSGHNSITVDSDGFMSFVVILDISFRKSNTDSSIALTNAFYNQGKWEFSSF